MKGGTWLGIYKDSPNKDLAWAFMQYVTCNSEAQQAYAKEYGEYVSLKSADQALAAEEQSLKRLIRKITQATRETPDVVSNLLLTDGKNPCRSDDCL